MLVSEKYLSKLQNETKFMKIGHTMPELQPFTFHEKFVAHPVDDCLNIQWPRIRLEFYT